MKNDLYEFPLDSLLTSDEWDHFRYLIEENLECLEVTDDMPLPFISYFEAETKKRLIGAGLKKDDLDDPAKLQKILKVINDQGLQWKDYRFDLHPLYGLPRNTYTVRADKKMFWVKPQIEAALLALESITIIKGLLLNNGRLNSDAVKVYLRSLELIINLSRAGNVVQKALQGERQSIRNSEKAGKKRKRGGKTPEEIIIRNQEILSSFSKWSKSANAFYIKYGKKQNLSPSAIRKIVKSQLVLNRVKC